MWRTSSSFGSLSKKTSWTNGGESSGGSPRRLGYWNVLHKVRLRELSLLIFQKKRLINSEPEGSLPLLKEGVERRWSQTFPQDVQRKEKRQQSHVAAKEFQMDKWKTLREWLSTGTGWLEKLWTLCPWRY